MTGKHTICKNGRHPQDTPSAIKFRKLAAQVMEPFKQYHAEQILVDIKNMATTGKSNRIRTNKWLPHPIKVHYILRRDPRFCESKDGKKITWELIGDDDDEKVR